MPSAHVVRRPSQLGGGGVLPVRHGLAFPAALSVNGLHRVKGFLLLHRSRGRLLVHEIDRHGNVPPRRRRDAALRHDLSQRPGVRGSAPVQRALGARAHVAVRVERDAREEGGMTQAFDLDLRVANGRRQVGKFGLERHGLLGMFALPFDFVALVALVARPVGGGGADPYPLQDGGGAPSSPLRQGDPPLVPQPIHVRPSLPDSPIFPHQLHQPFPRLTIVLRVRPVPLQRIPQCGAGGDERRESVRHRQGQGDVSGDSHGERPRRIVRFFGRTGRRRAREFRMEGEIMIEGAAGDYAGGYGTFGRCGGGGSRGSRGGGREEAAAFRPRRRIRSRSRYY
mmetsp:Transcript_8472/g.25588  ORF Transcript_8472/g.25588 Transcript_8472/m.25588 type:complete len:339 (-) Transcript_8472:137-1153(-)